MVTRTCGCGHTFGTPLRNGAGGDLCRAAHCWSHLSAFSQPMCTQISELGPLMLRFGGGLWLCCLLTGMVSAQSRGHLSW